MIVISKLGFLRILVNSLAKKFGFNLARLSTSMEIREVLELLRPRRFNDNLIRLGPNTDGGYVVPSTIHDIKLLISPGCNG